MELFFFTQAFFAVILGLILGSFFNVMIYRIPKGDSLFWPPSHCPICNHKISILENIPLFSYIFIGGKCVSCKTKIAIQYPIIESFTGLLMLLLWYFLIAPFLLENNNWWQYAVFFIKIMTLLILLPISIIDIRHYIIPDKITLGGLLIASLVAFLPNDISPLEMLFGIISGGGSLLIIALFGEYVLKKKDSMGGGDIKLMAFIGALWGWEIAILGIMLGAFLGTIIGLVILHTKKVQENENHIPFGPFLAVGTWIAVIKGNLILTWYFNLIL